MTQNNYYEKIMDGSWKLQRVLYLQVFFLQYVKHNKILPILIKHDIVTYCRHVGGIPIIHRSEVTNMKSVLCGLNCTFSLIIVLTKWNTVVLKIYLV